MKKSKLKGIWRMTATLFISCLLAFTSYAQDKNLTGTVVGEDGAPIPGVTVVVKGTTNGTITDMDGKFSFAAPVDAAILSVSYIGMKTQEITIGNQTKFNITLASDVIGVDEVVVVGYGTQQKKSVTGAVSTVNAEDIKAIPTANAAARLQGRVAGVTVVNDNSPGGDATVRVRGFGTINNNSPLYIIDGVPTESGLSRMNPNDIESMTVLKDASSSAIYGARAANGVIIITTNRGKKGAAKLTFDARFGIQRTTNQLDLLNTKQYGELVWLEFQNDKFLKPNATDLVPWQKQYIFDSGGNVTIPDYIIPTAAMEGDPRTNPALYDARDDDGSDFNLITKANKQGTNWYDEIFDPAPIQEYNTSITGGTDNSNYAFSLGYLNQKGVVIHSGFERFSMHANSDAKLTNWLSLGQSLGVAYTKRSGGVGDNNDEGNVVSEAYRMQPIVPVYDIAGNFAGTKGDNLGNGANPVAIATRNKDNWGTDLRVLGNAYVKIDFTKDLSFKSLLGVDLNNGRWKTFTIRDIEFFEAKSTNRLDEGHAYTMQWNWANTLNYKKVLNSVHSIDILVGSESIDNLWEEFTAGRASFFSEDIDYRYLNVGTASLANSGTASEWKSFSYFGRANYNYMGKYLFEGVIRRDASSRFHADTRWGTFPAASVGWRISEEKFMADTKNWLDDMKVRLGWGQNGNDRVNNYNYWGTLTTGLSQSYYPMTGDDTALNSGFYTNQLSNIDGKWETTTTMNLGLDMTMLGNKLEANLDLYSRKTSDMLYEVQLPAVYGNALRPSVNIGEMENKGIDLMLTYHGEISRDFKYTVRANASHYKNNVIKLNDNEKEELWGETERGNIYTVSKAGAPISSFYGYEVIGYFNSWEEANSYPAFGEYNAPGRNKYKDQLTIDTNNDGVADKADGIITPDDRVIIGSPHPDLTYGLNIDAQYKNFDISLFFQGSYGNDLINYVSRWTDYYQFTGNRSPQRLNESWTPERYASGAKITLPIAETGDTDSQLPNSSFVESGSYFRMKNLQIGYTLPKDIVSRMKISSLRLYVQATNLFTITPYSGLDPEIRSTNDQHNGLDMGIYPTSQTIMFGLNLSL
ncbi:MAG: TonB-dependent receptor [Prolixibacteraceae bacterium]|jgi:TonB-linked SusC/RagA family outer membrane protein